MIQLLNIYISRDVDYIVGRTKKSKKLKKGFYSYMPMVRSAFGDALIKMRCSKERRAYIAIGAVCTL